MFRVFFNVYKIVFVIFILTRKMLPINRMLFLLFTCHVHTMTSMRTQTPRILKYYFNYFQYRLN